MFHPNDIFRTKSVPVKLVIQIFVLFVVATNEILSRIRTFSLGPFYVKRTFLEGVFFPPWKRNFFETK